MDDGVENIVKFIQAVENYVVLYDYTNRHYANRSIQEKAWKEVGQEVNMSGLACKEKWKNIRSAYTRYLRQKSDCTSSGPKKRYYLAEHLKFLYPFTKTRSQNGNTSRISIPAEDTKEEATYLASDKDSEIDYSLCKTEEFFEEETTEFFCEDDKTSPDILASPSASPNVSRVSPDEVTKKRKEMDPLEICSVDYMPLKKKALKEEYPEELENADLHFLKSLLPDMHKMTNSQKYEFKYKTMKLIGDILYQSTHFWKNN